MPASELSGKKVLLVIAPENFRDEEFFEPRDLLGKLGAEVKVASTRKGVARGMLGARVDPDLVISEARAGDYDAVVVVGGAGSPAHLWPDRNLHRLLREAAESGRVIAAICLSGGVLARAGLLKGRQATVYRTEASLEEFKAGGAIYRDREVVTDGKFITADGPRAAAMFGREIAKQLAG